MKIPVHTKILVGAALIVGGVALACSSDSGGGPSTPKPLIAKTAANSGNAQQGTVAQALALPLQVLVTLSGAPQVGTNITWATTSGSVAPTTSATDASGIATTTWTLGQASGGVTATATLAGATGSPQTFTATALADAATEITIAGGNNQTAAVGSVLAPLQVTVADQFGNGVPGEAVAWAVTSAAGTGTVTPPNSNTDATGVATSTLTLGNVVGAVTVDATSGALTGSPLTFTATAEPLPTAITIQVGSPGTSFSPKVDTVAVGGTVTWNWATSGHSVTDDPGVPTFTDHDQLENAGFVHGPITFSTAGSYAYHCLAHGASGGVGMSGVIVVK